MPHFSTKSYEKLMTCHDNIRRLFEEVIKHYDCTIVQGYRSKLDQNLYYQTGKSKVKYPNSKHNSNPSMAVDVAPYINGSVCWDELQCRHFAGFVMGVASQMRMAIRWGGDWDGDKDMKDQNFNDLVHFELVK